jgi:hypothetical protein
VASLVVAFILPVSLSGCVVSTVAGVATAPVRVAGKAADWATTSQSEADRNSGRALRHREEQLGKLERAYADSQRACQRGERSACDRARAQYGEIEALRPTVPAEPR